jgi:hypothetical protein
MVLTPEYALLDCSGRLTNVGPWPKFRTQIIARRDHRGVQCQEKYLQFRKLMVERVT